MTRNAIGHGWTNHESSSVHQVASKLCVLEKHQVAGGMEAALNQCLHLG
jgi:hypothetical protein